MHFWNECLFAYLQVILLERTVNSNLSITDQFRESTNLPDLSRKTHKLLYWHHLITSCMILCKQNKKTNCLNSTKSLKGLQNAIWVEISSTLVYIRSLSIVYIKMFCAVNQSKLVRSICAGVKNHYGATCLNFFTKRLLMRPTYLIDEAQAYGSEVSRVKCHRPAHQKQHFLQFSVHFGFSSARTSILSFYLRLPWRGTSWVSTHFLMPFSGGAAWTV